jgi:hypothetical protein
MSNIVERGGAVHVRLGGNTQETATLVAQTTNGSIIQTVGTVNQTVRTSASNHYVSRAHILERQARLFWTTPSMSSTSWAMSRR